MKKIPFRLQLDQEDCGPTCLQIVSMHYKRNIPIAELRSLCGLGKGGVSVANIVDAAEKIGFRSMAVQIPYDSDNTVSLTHAPTPCIAYFKKGHFVVVFRVGKRSVTIADPAVGVMKMRKKAFMEKWTSSDKNEGLVVLLEPTPQLIDQDKFRTKKEGDLSFFLKYLGLYRHLILQLLLGIVVGSFLQLSIPFLTQSIIDIGLENNDLYFIYIIFLGQLMIFLGQTTVKFIQNWILLHIGIRIKVSLVADFLIKLMRLPLGYFDARKTGDILQRVADNYRVEELLTSSILNIFSFFYFIVFGLILLIYNVKLFLIFIAGSAIYVIWIISFLKKRREVENQRFINGSKDKAMLVELIQGMQEIKLQASERKRRWKWAILQAEKFQVRVNDLRLIQYQDGGASLINHLKDILISFITAKAVLDGTMSLGMMLAVQYILGQLNTPLQQFVAFSRSLQDAKITLSRLGEIHNMENEESEADTRVTMLPSDKNIYIEDLSFKYENGEDFVLKDISLAIPEKKITAIVGTSGSGKTTLIKLLLGFYFASKGSIKVGNINLNNLSKELWRKKCGAVLQDGFIFSDSVGNNIAESDASIDEKKLMAAAVAANALEFIENLPASFSTKIGPSGTSLSQGQKQRILISRAVYKEPDFLFFDEATNALDAENERKIVENMSTFFQGRTVVVVAHRLSTVRNADQIIVLDKGVVREVGSHEELVKMKGDYYNLIKNQLELGL